MIDKYHYGQKVDDNTTIIGWDAVTESSVYVGGVNSLRKIIPNWHEEPNIYVGDIKYLRLGEIAKQVTELYPHEIITVFVSSPTSGHVFQYGNYGDYWIYYGELFGYA